MRCVTMRREPAPLTPDGYIALPAPTGTARPLRVVYYHPSDRPPLAGYRERIRRVLMEIQRFYADGLRQHGWSDTGVFQLDLDQQNELRVILAPGALATAQHERGRTEPQLHEAVDRALKAAGFDPAQETYVIFSNLLLWEDGRSREVGPYYGGGGPQSGMAAVLDDPLLDPDKLGSNEPGAWFATWPCTIGEFNAHYIGGTAHELGHAFGLPHNRESETQRKTLGTSLMGAGNHVYGNELRPGAGLGAFLAAADAMMLASHPMFRPGVIPGSDDPQVTWRIQSVRRQKGALHLVGEVRAAPVAYGVVAFVDPPGDSDYDARTDCVRLRADGRFALHVPDVPDGAWTVRLEACLVDGRRSAVTAPCRVDERGAVDARPLQRAAWEQPIFLAYQRNDRRLIERSLSEYSRAMGRDAEVRSRVAIMRAWLKPHRLVRLQDAPRSMQEVSLSDVEWESASVGWAEPLRNRVVYESGRPLYLCVNDTAVPYGLFAHAPSRVVYRLDGRWRRFQCGCALQHNAHGSVQFVVQADGRTLYRSAVVKHGERHDLDLDVTRVDRLELLIEDGGDGWHSDWGLWLEPRLLR